MRRTLPAFALALAIGTAWLGAQQALRVSAPGPDTAILSQGTLALRGLPFFSPNAIRALGGEYSMGSSRIQVWFTRDRLVYSDAWKRTSLAGYLARVQSRKEGQAEAPRLFALSLGSYELFVQVPEDSPLYRSFVQAFERRFAIFYANAKDDSELSFPAFVDLRAK